MRRLLFRFAVAYFLAYFFFVSLVALPLAAAVQIRYPRLAVSRQSPVVIRRFRRSSAIEIRSLDEHQAGLWRLNMRARAPYQSPGVL